ncbi:MAG: FAD-binding oxidoreductase [Deltaproteobacteria bacterium]|nr:FAD-binding oxidoreductase [Deltaproteobacteria bacterium]
MSHTSPLDPAPDWDGFDDDLRESHAAAGTPADCGRFTIDGIRPVRVLFPRSSEQVCRILEIASTRGVALVPAGFGAHLGLGAPPRRPFAILSLVSINALVDHQPANMTVTAQAGMSVSELQAAVAESGQWLPVEPPLPADTSVGGLISADLSGPSRFSQGTVRDLLIGITVARADGTLAKSGGRVVKNVAGYDLAKLYCGALGTLGVIVEATFKLRALPATVAMARVTCRDVAEAGKLLEGIRTAPLEPLLIELLTPVPAGGGDCVIMLGFGGSEEDVADQRRTLTGLARGNTIEELTGEDAGAALAELRDGNTRGEGVLKLKAALLPTDMQAFVAALEHASAKHGLTMAMQAHAGNGIVRVRVNRPEVGNMRYSARALVEELRAAAAALGGTLVVEQAASDVKPELDIWGGEIAALPLMRRIKETLDPKGVLSPGRFVGGI